MPISPREEAAVYAIQDYETAAHNIRKRRKLTFAQEFRIVWLGYHALRRETMNRFWEEGEWRLGFTIAWDFAWFLLLTACIVAGLIWSLGVSRQKWRAFAFREDEDRPQPVAAEQQHET